MRSLPVTPHTSPTDARRLRGDGGFGLVEASIALGIVFIALTALAATATTGMRDIALSRQRQTANGLANRILEQVRAARWADIGRGLSSTDAAFVSDQNIVNCSGAYRYKTCTGETIVSTPGLVNAAPFVPHRTTSGPPTHPSTYTVSLYVTRAADAPAAGAYRVTTRVGWTNPMRAGSSSTVEAQTLVYQPTGCVDPATQPYAAPCNPFYYSTGSVSAGRVEISGTLDGATVGSDLALPQIRSDGQIEQLAKIQGVATGSGATLGSQTIASSGLTSLADDDPATSPVPGAYDSRSLDPSANGTFSTTGSSGSVLRVRRAAATASSDSGSAAGAIAAGGSHVCPLPPAAPATDGLLCGSTRIQQLTSLESTLDLSVLGTSLGTATIARVGAAPAATSLLARRASSGTGDGRITLIGGRSMGQVDLLGMPSLVSGLPLLWDGSYVRLSGYADTATATAGAGTNAPSGSVTGGTIHYWNGVGYSTASVGAMAATVPLGALETSMLLSSTPVTVRLSGTLSTGGVTTSQTPGTAGSGATRTESQVRIGSPVIANLRFVVTVAGTPTVDLGVTIDLGSLVVRTAYQAASGA